MLRHLATILCLTAPQALVSASELSSPATTRDAATRGLAFLTKDAMAWKTERNCASCHHAPYMLWTLNEAKARGYAVDEKALAEMTEWVSAQDDPSRSIPKMPPSPTKIVHFNALMLALGLEAGAPKSGAAKEALDRYLGLLREDQEKEGTWSLPAGGRLPMSGTPEMMTTWTLLAMTGSGDVGNRPASERALQWLAAAKPEDDLLAVNLRLLLRARLHRPKGEIRPLIKEILSRQNSDGGWSQAKELASDGYATGQAAYALVEAGVKPSSKEVKRAQEFLVRTQQPDGSWPMISRPAAPGGAGSKDLRPIVYAGSAWATLGLVRATAGRAIASTRP